jgi:hypothetical protein
MQKNRLLVRLAFMFPHVGNNLLSLYISIRLFQWTTFFLSPLPEKVFFNIEPLTYMILLHTISFTIGIFLLFKFPWSPIIAQFYQIFIVWDGLFFSTSMGEVIMTFILHGLWIFYFSFSSLVKNVYETKPFAFR